MGKGAVSHGHLIDEHCKYKDATLVEHGGDVYTCMLNQTDLKSNKNKFYTMQVIQTGSKFVHFIRYGRIGEVGRIDYHEYSIMALALGSFQKQFKSKTGNGWYDRANFQKKDGKYFLADVSYEAELKNIDEVKEQDIPKSKLPKRTQDLLKMISDVNMMKNSLVELDIDPQKMPLGKITTNQINSAKELLIQIENKLQNKGMLNNDDDADSEELKTMLDDDIINLCSQYYTLIPYSCGRTKPPIIQNKKMIDKYRQNLDDLMNIVVGVQIVNNVKTNENPLDAIYADINTTITPLRKNTKMWNEIDKYIINTHGETHGSKLRLIDIYEIQQAGKQKEFDEYCKDIGNRMLLFHGSQQCCILSIFKNDFYLDPTRLNDPRIQIAGKLLGYGVYFADMATKSFNYTRAQATNNIGFLILAEVAVGNISKKNNPDYGITKESLAKEKCHSALGLGKWGPTSSTMINGVNIPNGNVGVINNNTYLRYNEYVVYDIKQINIKYLVVLENLGNYSGY
jgi:predicted DNA-binding WGR domain protein